MTLTEALSFEEIKCIKAGLESLKTGKVIFWSPIIALDRLEYFLYEPEEPSHQRGFAGRGIYFDTGFDFNTAYRIAEEPVVPENIEPPDLVAKMGLDRAPYVGMKPETFEWEELWTNNPALRREMYRYSEILNEPPTKEKILARARKLGLFKLVWKLFSEDNAEQLGTDLAYLEVKLTDKPPCLMAYFAQPIAKWLIGMTDDFVKSTEGLDRKTKGSVLEAIGLISKYPITQKGDTVKPLNANLKGLWRYRIGDFRLVYKPDIKNKTVFLILFAKRSDAYQ